MRCFISLCLLLLVPLTARAQDTTPLTQIARWEKEVRCAHWLSDDRLLVVESFEDAVWGPVNEN